MYLYPEPSSLYSHLVLPLLLIGAHEIVNVVTYSVDK